MLPTIPDRPSPRAHSLAQVASSPPAPRARAGAPLLLRPPSHADQPTVYAGFLRAGYGWVFPHQNRLMIGVGGHSLVHGKEFINKFKEFLVFLGLPAALAETAKGHGLPYGNFLKHPWYGRTLLAGDAAGLVETLFGEGIYYALRSGELAGEAVYAALTRGEAPETIYGRGLKRDILPELSWSRKLRRLLYASQHLGFLPLLCFVRGGGRLLAEMVHGVRSYRLLRRRAAGPREEEKTQKMPPAAGGMAAQKEVSAALLEDVVGREMEVLVDAPHPEWPGLHVGRVWFQAPEIDGVTYVSGPGVRPGAMVAASIEEAKDYDLVALA